PDGRDRRARRRPGGRAPRLGPPRRRRPVGHGPHPPVAALVARPVGRRHARRPGLAGRAARGPVARVRPTGGRDRRTPDGGGLVIDPRVEQLRRIVVAEVGEETARRAQLGLPPLDPVDRRQMARSILRRELDGQWRAAQQRGEMTLTPEEEDRIVEEVLAGLFSQLPGLEAYLARQDVTDIFVVGCDNVRLRTLDGREHKVPPVAASDEELVAQIQALARKGGRLGLDDGPTEIEKEFSPARPILDLQLSDGSRLAAVAWVSARPYVSVRRHALVDATQDTLVHEWHMYDEGVATLLRAAMQARLNILVAGGMGRGKTTLMRALLHECPPDERIVVL